MARSDRFLLRVVIQRIDIGSGATWRIVAYGGRDALGHADFPSRKMLLDVLLAAIPDFDEGRLTPEALSEAGSSIVFAGEMELDAAQLSLLGLS